MQKKNTDSEQLYKKVGPYQLTQELGSGANSRVYKAKSIVDNEFYAVKMIPQQNLDQEQKKLIDNEIEILLSLQHPNIVRLVDMKKTPNNWYLIFEFCDQGDLNNYIKHSTTGKLSEQMTQMIVKQLCEGLKEVRKLNIVH